MAESPNLDQHVQMLTELVLESARQTQAAQRNTRENSIKLAEARRVHEGSYESMLANDVERLTDRLTMLYARPLFRRMGKHTLNVLYQAGHKTQWGGYENPRIISEPIPDGEVAIFEDKQLVFSGLLAWRYAPKRNKFIDNRTLHFDRQIKDETTGVALSQNLYCLLPYEGKIGPRVQVKGGEFDDYEKARCQEIIADYAKAHPWVAGLGQHFVYDFPGSDGRVQKHVPHYSFSFHNVPQSVPESGYEDRLAKLDRELVPLLSPGEAWDFPDEMFLEPLALVQQMNLHLGTKNK